VSVDWIITLNVENAHHLLTHTCSRMRWSFTALSMAFSRKADQIKCSAFLYLGTGFGFYFSLR